MANDVVPIYRKRKRNILIPGLDTDFCKTEVICPSGSFADFARLFLVIPRRAIAHRGTPEQLSSTAARLIAWSATCPLHARRPTYPAPHASRPISHWHYRTTAHAYPD